MKGSSEKLAPAALADCHEMLAQQTMEMGDKESALHHMEVAHAIRHLLRTLGRLNQRVHSGYDFNADPDQMTLEVGDLLSGFTLENEIRLNMAARQALKPVIDYVQAVKNRVPIGIVASALQVRDLCEFGCINDHPAVRRQSKAAPPKPEKHAP